jgi:hypothetical protein
LAGQRALWRRLSAEARSAKADGIAFIEK